MRRITGWCTGLVGMVVLAAVTPAAPTAADPASAATDCVAPADLVVNRWIGQTAAGDVGYWTQNSRCYRSPVSSATRPSKPEAQQAPSRVHSTLSRSPLSTFSQVTPPS